MSMYYIKTGLEYWKPKGYGYTKNREEAGVFTLKDMEKLNLDGCTGNLISQILQICFCNHSTC